MIPFVVDQPITVFVQVDPLAGGNGEQNAHQVAFGDSPNASPQLLAPLQSHAAGQLLHLLPGHAFPGEQIT